MLFNSLGFLIFFPIVATLYFITPKKIKRILLLISSCVFYMSYKPSYVLILFFLIIVDFAAGIFISKAKNKKRTLFLILSISSNVLILSYFKYFNFLMENLSIALAQFGASPQLPNFSLLLPLGLSFHTFQSMSYTIEVYKKRQKAEKNFITYALYVMFFPQLVAGPIERPQQLLNQFNKHHVFDYKRVTTGLKIMAWGFFKKLVIADRLALFVNPVFNNSPYSQPGISFILATIFFSYQIYCDFSGYSDIAVGTAKVLGFNLVQNFKSPYFSKSPSEFWRRWHISLSSWFRDYVYIPLGGNRVKFPVWSINILITFLLSGLWHGANWTFIIWGILHGLFLIVSRLFSVIFEKVKYLNVILKYKIISLIRVFITFCLISFAWIFFRSSDLTQAIYISSNLFKGINDYLFNILNAAKTLNYIPLDKIFDPILNTNTTADALIVISAIIFMETFYIIQGNSDAWAYR